MHKLPRDYFTLIENIKKTLPNSNCHFSTIGEIPHNKEIYKLVKILFGKGNSRRVLITGGIHGDEIGGVSAIVEFFKQKLFEEFLDEWEITVIPCINPTGYILNTRNNHEDKDLNRLFKEDNLPHEVAAIQEILNSPFELTLDLHEDLDTPGLYIYMKELNNTNKALGKKVIKAMSEFIPINMENEIEETPAKDGLISDLPDPDEMDWWPLAMYAIDRGSKTSFTTETSTNFSIEKRIACHISAIQTAMRSSRDV